MAFPFGAEGQCPPLRVGYPSCCLGWRTAPSQAIQRRSSVRFAPVGRTGGYRPATSDARRRVAGEPAEWGVTEAALHGFPRRDRARSSGSARVGAFSIGRMNDGLDDNRRSCKRAESAARIPAKSSRETRHAGSHGKDPADRPELHSGVVGKIPRRAKGPRLYWHPQRQQYYIRDGSRFRATAQTTAKSLIARSRTTGRKETGRKGRVIRPE